MKQRERGEEIERGVVKSFVKHCVCHIIYNLCLVTIRCLTFEIAAIGISDLVLYILAIHKWF